MILLVKTGSLYLFVIVKSNKNAEKHYFDDDISEEESLILNMNATWYKNTLLSEDVCKSCQLSENNPLHLHHHVRPPPTPTHP